VPKQPLGRDFVGIPVKTLKSGEWKALQASTRCVYIAMLTRYYRSGDRASDKVKWTYDEVAFTTGLSRRTVRRAIQELRLDKWMTVWEPGSRWKQSTTYVVNPAYANDETPESARI